jgi:23S rRNA (guanosine2251-2'-O)-methyltransferase
VAGPHVIPGRRPVAEALAAARELHEVLLDRRGDLPELEGVAQAAGVPVRRAAREELDRLAQGVVHQGTVALAPPFPYVDLGALAGAALLVVLDHVTDPQNLGAIARTVEQAGGGGLVLPRRRSAHVTPAVEKAAAGALSWLPLAVVANTARAIGELRDAGVWSVGLDAAASETVWDCPLLDGPVAVVVGAEDRGLARLVAERVDALAAIPTAGRLGSLNAGVAVAVACFEHVRRNASARAQRTS